LLEITISSIRAMPQCRVVDLLQLKEKETVAIEVLVTMLYYCLFAETLSSFHPTGDYPKNTGADRRSLQLASGENVRLDYVFS
jgi:hypothetical protein